MLKKKRISPYLLIIISFLFAITIGGILLSLPIATVGGKGTPIIDGIFTATSAICVTGLVVNDISVTYNMFGQIIILILIQLGGLGIITFSSMIVLLMSKKIGYYAQKAVQEDLNYDTTVDIPKYIKKVSTVVFGIEILGAILLFIEFHKIYDLPKAIYFSIFHAISAFCNAGFTLYTLNLESFVTNVNINIVITFLIIFGGLGFSAIIDIYNILVGNRKKLTVTTKFSISITVILLVIGTILFFVLEYKNIYTLAGLSTQDKILASYFQSVTTRTAGFNTVPLNTLMSSTILIFVILMFIGASPGSTGGGVKTTTFGIILLGVFTALKNREYIEYNKRRITWNNFNKATIIMSFAISYVFIALIILSILEPNIEFLKLLFEMVSAFGTVGVSMGVTPLLSTLSKILIIITMFIGRTGVLTIALSLSRKSNKSSSYKYPSESMLIG